MSKPKKRKLTAFLCQELLYDYAIDALDPDRRAAVEEFLKEDSATREMLETIRRGLEYAEQLSKFKISQPLAERLQESENIVSISKKISSYQNYPDWVKWSLVALLTSACIAMLAVIVPWAKLLERSQVDSKTVVLAPLLTDKESSEEQSDESNEHESSGDFDESGAPVEDPVVPLPKATVAAVKPIPVGTIPPLDKLPKAAGAPATAPVESESDVAAAAEVEDGSELNSGEQSSGADQREVRAKGFVYRGFMTVENIENVSDQIVQQIKELGGKKAGEVELGWKRGSLRYFHFTMPTSSEERLLELLRAYGPVRISKDPHPRVMPDGQVRFILSIDAK